MKDFPPHNKRQAYRSRVEAGDDAVEASVIPADGAALRARVRDCSSGGVALALLEEPADPLRTGQRVEIRFSRAGAGESIASNAMLVRREGDEEEHLLAFSFVERAALYEQVRGDWWTLFNRRTSFRVVLADGELRELALLAPSVSERTTIHDIGFDGVGAMVEADAAERLRGVDSLRISLGLDPGVRPLTFFASPRHLTPAGERVYLGLELDARRSPEYATRSRQIARFLISIQRGESSEAPD